MRQKKRKKPSDLFIQCVLPCFVNQLIAALIDHMIRMVVKFCNNNRNTVLKWF